ncbi:hypothetical protein V8324_10255 [Roseovarius sp. D22-M7]
MTAPAIDVARIESQTYVIEQEFMGVLAKDDAQNSSEKRNFSKRCVDRIPRAIVERQFGGHPKLLCSPLH